MSISLGEFIESSFLSSLISNPDVTDISYNGEKIFYENKLEGRKCSSIEISNNDAINFIRQVANLSEKQFSYSSPILDVSYGKYRFNAVHPSVSRFRQNKVISFSIRIASLENMINKDENFYPENFIEFINEILKLKKSIIIGGKTGAGKTELQKFLINSMPDNERVILIDQIDEIGYSNSNPSIDITHWVANNSINQTTISNLISNALRCNPDWIVVSEARGKEMSDVLLSSMSGHPIITTIHAKECSLIIPRIVRMIYLNDKSSTYEEIEEEVFFHFDYFFYLSKVVTKKGNVQRFISAIGKSDTKKKTMELIYKKGVLNNLSLEINNLKEE